VAAVQLVGAVPIRSDEPEQLVTPEPVAPLEPVAEIAPETTHIEPVAEAIARIRDGGSEISSVKRL